MILTDYIKESIHSESENYQLEKDVQLDFRLKEHVSFYTNRTYSYFPEQTCGVLIYLEDVMRLSTAHKKRCESVAGSPPVSH